MARPEHNLQQAAWAYAQHVLPPEADFASVETKLGRNDAIGAAMRKAAGVRAGQPDCQIIYKGRVSSWNSKRAHPCPTRSTSATPSCAAPGQRFT